MGNLFPQENYELCSVGNRIVYPPDRKYKPDYQHCIEHCIRNHECIKRPCMIGRIDSAFQGEKALDLDLSAKYGKAWDNSEDLVFTYNVVFEFAMP